MAKQAVELPAPSSKSSTVGLLRVEFFTKTDTEQSTNAPRPHNSGHLTFDSCVTSRSNNSCELSVVYRSARPKCSALPPWRICSDPRQVGELNWGAACAFLWPRPQPTADNGQCPGRKSGVGIAQVRGPRGFRGHRPKYQEVPWHREILWRQTCYGRNCRTDRTEQRAVLSTDCGLHFGLVTSRCEWIFIGSLRPTLSASAGAEIQPYRSASRLRAASTGDYARRKGAQRRVRK